MSGAEPSGYVPSDLLATAALGVAAAVAGSRARRWTWLVLTGVAAAFVEGDGALLASALGVTLAFISSILRERRSAVMGATVGALGVQVILRMHIGLFFGDTALVAFCAVTPMLVSAFRHARRSTRTSVVRLAIVSVFLGAGAACGLGLAVHAASDSMRDAAARAQRGLDAARDGDREAAVRELEASGREFARARRTLRAPWARPALALPILGHNARAATGLAISGEDVAAAAAAAAESVDYDELKASGGQIDLILLEEAQAPVREAAEVLDRSRRRLERASNPWLLSELGEPLSDLLGDITRASEDAEVAAGALDVAPTLLGGSSEKRYLIAFATPSETRYLGGFIGAWGELTVDDGRFELGESGRIDDLSSADGFETRTIEGVPGFTQRYAEWYPTWFVQNATITPDFPTAAEVLRQLYFQATGRSIHGVIYVDPYGLAALLELSGPVRVEGLEGRLTWENAPELLLRDQYLMYDTIDERTDLLTSALEATFSALTERDLPGPRRLAAVLGPAVRQGRLYVEVFDDGGTDLLDRIGVRGDLPLAEGKDFVSVRGANAAGNKIDAYLSRDMDYDIKYDPATGVVEGTLDITLANDAPSTGLPDYVIGNRDSRAGNEAGMSSGTNRMSLAVYTAAQVRSVTVDGRSAPYVSGRDKGHNVTTFRVDVPPGAKLVVSIELDGRVGSDSGYELLFDHQPMVNPDRATVAVRSGNPSWRARDSDKGVVTRDLDLVEDREVTVGFRR